MATTTAHSVHLPPSKPRALREQNVKLRHPLDVVCGRTEEGGIIGSKLAIGDLTEANLEVVVPDVVFLKCTIFAIHTEKVASALGIAAENSAHAARILHHCRRLAVSNRLDPRRAASCLCAIGSAGLRHRRRRLTLGTGPCVRNALLQRVVPHPLSGSESATGHRQRISACHWHWPCARRDN